MAPVKIRKSTRNKRRYGVAMCSVVRTLVLLLPGAACSVDDSPSIPFVHATDTVTGTDLTVLPTLLGHPETPSNAAFDLAWHADPGAGRHLLAALPKYAADAPSAVVVPLIQALGERGEPAATPAVVPYLAHADPAVAEAAGWAILRLERHSAVPPLRALARRADRARFDRLLREADLLFAEEALRLHNRAAAERVYRPLFSRERPPADRLAGLRGLAAARGDAAAAFLIESLTDDTPALRHAAARLLETLPPGTADRVIAAELPRSPEPAAILLLEVLAKRNAPATRSAVRLAARAQSTDVRIGALRALSVLGDESDVSMLATAAAMTEGDEQTAARDALRDLPAPGVDAMLRSSLGTVSSFVSSDGDLTIGDPGFFVELIRTAAARRTPGVAAPLRPMLASSPSGIAAAAADALGTIGTLDDYIPLLDALVAPSAREDAVGASLEKALITLVGRLADRTATAPPALSALATARAGARPALLRVLAAVGGDAARRAVFREVSTEATREPAIRALAGWKDPGPAGDLLALVPLLPPGPLPVLALRGAIRLATLEGDLPATDRLSLVVRALSLATRDEERKQALAALGRLDTPAAWTRLEPFFSRPGFEAEAAGAAAKLAATLRKDDPEIARAAAKAALAHATSDEVRKSARKTLTALDASRDYLGSWVVSQPFTEQGAGPEKLHGIAFPPERDPEATTWTRIDPPGTGKFPFTLPLGDAVGGENRAVYLRTRVFVPAAARAALEIGADDGLKAWVNGAQIADDFALRAMEPGDIRAEIELRKGWNEIMLKVSQGDGAWEACARIRTPTGGTIPGLKSERP